MILTWCLLAYFKRNIMQTYVHLYQKDDNLIFYSNHRSTWNHAIDALCFDWKVTPDYYSKPQSVFTNFVVRIWRWYLRVECASFFYLIKWTGFFFNGWFYFYRWSQDHTPRSWRDQRLPYWTCNVSGDYVTVIPCHLGCRSRIDRNSNLTASSLC